MLTPHNRLTKTSCQSKHPKQQPSFKTNAAFLMAELSSCCCNNTNVMKLLEVARCKAFKGCMMPKHHASCMMQTKLAMQRTTPASRWSFY